MKNLVFGKQVLKHLIQHYPHLLIEIFIKTNHSLQDVVSQSNVSYQFWTLNQFEKAFPQQNHQFIAATIQPYQYYSLKQLLQDFEQNSNLHHLVLILDHIQDPHNFGAILRTALATQVDAVIIPNFNQAPINTLTIKAATGHIFGLKIVQVANLTQAIIKLKKDHFWTFSSTSEVATDYAQVNFQNMNIALIVGNENQGISKLLQKHSDFKISIPMYQTESLNVSNATAILLYQIRQNQNFWIKN